MNLRKVQMKAQKMKILNLKIKVVTHFSCNNCLNIFITFQVNEDYVRTLCKNLISY